MGARGKKSSAALEVIRQADVISAITRPEPPEFLTPDQAEEWVAITDRMPADWFLRETHGLLAQYCRHAVTARRIAVMIEDLMQGSSDHWLDDFEKLTRMQEREGRAANALARSMRLTQQSRYSTKKRAGGAKRPGDPEKPWQGG